MEDGVPLYRTPAITFVNLVDTHAFQLVGFSSAMLLHHLQGVALDADDEIPLAIRKDLEVNQFFWFLSCHWSRIDIPDLSLSIISFSFFPFCTQRYTLPISQPPMSAWGFSLVYKKKVNNRLEIPAGIYDPLIKERPLTASKKNPSYKVPSFLYLM